jgi:hypothetical protein
MGYRRSSVPNLYRDERTGIYYVRTKVHGRTIWKTLQTNEFRVAKLRAPKELGDLQKGRNALSSLVRALPALAAWPNCIEVASSPIHVSSRHQKSIGARP